MAATGLHISLSAEPIFHIGNFAITNSMFTSLLVSSLLIIFAFTVNKSLKHVNKPQGLQNFAEWIVESLYNLTYSVTGDMRKAGMFFPLVSTFFLFILINNWFGLLPGVGTILTKAVEEVEHVTEKITSQPESAPAANLSMGTELDEHGEALVDQHEGETIAEEQSATEEIHITENAAELAAIPEEHEAPAPFLRPGTADLNMTIALGLIAMGAVQLFGYHYLKGNYFKKFFNFSSPIMFYVGLLELISEVSKIVSFAFRLFGNIFAGEVLLMVIGSLIGIIAPIPFYGLEVFVGFIQALVFSMLSLVLMNMATMSHDEH
jgi:F-type H+-transporting ATPase subunit a